MSYSQKYTIVQFVEPVEIDYTFTMEDWPLHVTLADVFAIELNGSLIAQLANFLNLQDSHSVETGDETNFGSGNNTTAVRLIKNTPELQLLHEELVKVLLMNGAAFNSPEFTNEGYLPHITKQKNTWLDKGQSVSITQLSLIDMFVDGDWQKRKVLKNFKLKE